MRQVLTALITPFDENGLVDYESLEKIIKLQLDGGCGIVLFGTTGECPTLTSEERKQILKLVKEKFESNISNFIIGVGGNNTQECILNVEEGKKFGFETFMITCPYYNKPSQEGMKAHFSSICEKFLENNFIIYNIPGRTCVNLLPKTLCEICSSNLNVVGVKEASGDLNQMIMVKKLCPDILMYSGDDSLLIPTLSIEGFGVISVISNLIPEKIVEIVNLYNENKCSTAFEKYLEYDELIRLMFVETNPVPIKFIMSYKGLIKTDNVRLPLIKMSSNENKNKIINLTKKY
jgi:4-hydroxy-tetrahydrodipicolinate synthase